MISVEAQDTEIGFFTFWVLGASFSFGYLGILGLAWGFVDCFSGFGSGFSAYMHDRTADNRIPISTNVLICGSR